MALRGELKGLSGTVCEDCEVALLLDVQQSAAGFYLGYFCGNCGPYSRETGYFAAHEEAQEALDAWLMDCKVPDNVRECYDGMVQKPPEIEVWEGRSDDA